MATFLLAAAALVVGAAAPAAARADAVITGGPPPVSGPEVWFTFTNDEDEREDDDDDDRARRREFVCRLNGALQQFCWSPTRIRGLADGAYLFEVRARRGGGGWARYAWVVSSAPAPGPAPAPAPAPAMPEAPAAEIPPSPPAPPAPPAGATGESSSPPTASSPGRVDSTGSTPPAPAPPAPGPPTDPAAPGAAPAGPALMTPFPLVRLAGLIYPRSVRIRVLSVRAPVGARISVRCRGRSCPVRSTVRLVRAKGSRTAATMAFGRLQNRRLTSGTRLEIRVTSAGRIGKYTSFRFRAGAAPRRVDRCLIPGRSAPAPCPA